ncbi:amino acid ABC transporter permease [Brevibacterium sediminis]|uniref:Amino acid ABC transporter permease n=1 Tax=Brevibacterium sediminis TaxID=1857024 RepID=A0ABQ1M4I6_9MICO|nr:amino acid ABC transporter permease [Brevibacterium sediminis]GGC34604.1 amino acid ABC transporter permease [Brevibacterium sediminis]
MTQVTIERSAEIETEEPTEPLKVVRVRHWGRWAVSAVIILLIAQFLWSLVANEKYGWGTFGEYFFSDAVLDGLLMTLWLTVISIVGGFIIGTVLAVFRLSSSTLLNAVAWWYIWFFRSVPILVQVLVWYNLGYLYPRLGLGTPFTDDFWIFSFPTTSLLTAFAAVAIGLTLHQAAYSAEIIRGGIVSVDAGQTHAAAALGLPRRVRFFRIILPQAARSILPAGFNEIVGQVKGTSVAFIVALPELFYSVQVIYGRNQQIIPLLLVAVVWYAIITTVLSVVQYYVERRFSRGTVDLPPTPIYRAKKQITDLWHRLGEEDGKASPAVTSQTDTVTSYTDKESV